jgi:hypothetical protein
MRDIVGNHVILTRRGRAGDDVIVGDAAADANARVIAKIDAYLKSVLSPVEMLTFDELISHIGGPSNDHGV